MNIAIDKNIGKKILKVFGRIINICEDNCFTVISLSKYTDLQEYAVELERYTPFDEDWILTISYDGTYEGFRNAICDTYNQFDVDEDVDLYVNHRGENGIPSSIRELLENAEWKEQKLEELYRSVA